MLTWVHERGLILRLIDPGKPNQNAYIESAIDARAKELDMVACRIWPNRPHCQRDAGRLSDDC
jgi:hypothetical protein